MSKKLEKILYKLPKIIRKTIDEVEYVREKALEKAKGKISGKLVEIAVDCTIHLWEDGISIYPYDFIYWAKTEKKVEKYIIVDGFLVKVKKIGRRTGEAPEWMRKYQKLKEVLYLK